MSKTISCATCALYPATAPCDLCRERMRDAAEAQAAEAAGEEMRKVHAAEQRASQIPAVKAAIDAGAALPHIGGTATVLCGKCNGTFGNEADGRCESCGHMPADD